jgi:Sulfotransferase domain
MAQALQRYRNVVSDSLRWNGFVFRDDDIVISTPPKCGTTWMQMICALLIFQCPALPLPLTELSPCGTDLRFDGGQPDRSSQLPDVVA